MCRADRAILIFYALLVLLSDVSCVRRFFLVSDYDYDPFYGTPLASSPKCSLPTSPWGLPGCNSPEQLLISLSTDMFDGAPQFVISCGDWLAYEAALNESDAIAAFDWMANLTKLSTSLSTMPAPTVAAALGECDIYDVTDSNTTIYLDTLASTLLNNSIIAAAEVATFESCGFFSRNVTPTLCIIVLNTDLWSVSGPSANSADPDPCGQLKFLSDALDQARASGRVCIIVGHRPPGIDITAPLEEVTPNTLYYWIQAYQSAYIPIIWSNRDVISVQLFGHAHAFSLIADPNLGVPLFVLPSISSVAGSNPSYLLASLDETTWHMTSLQQRYLDKVSGLWKDGMVIEEILGTGTALGSLDALRFAAADMGTDDAKWQAFQTVRGGGLLGNAPQCDNVCRAIVSCTTQSIDIGTISACLPKSTLNMALKVIVTVTVCVGSLFVAMTIGVVVLRRKTILFDADSKSVPQ